ncbi:MAG: hypothetical protein KDB61_01425 [Planctomycetes bacterium]|nr:hypothetical protein [Planctomycetota bacterium]
MRFKPDPNVVAFIETSYSGLNEPFKREMTSLIVSESHTGCALVVPATDHLQEGDLCRILLEPGGLREGAVVWRRQLDSDTIKVGIHFQS